MHCHSRQNSTAPHGAKGRNNSQYCCANNVACFSGVKTNATTPNKTTRNSMQQAVQTDATSNIQQCCVRLHRALLKQKCRYSKAPRKRTQHCWMLHVASVCTPCYMLFRVVAQSLKPVKLLATCKQTQKLPTMLRAFSRGFSPKQSQSSDMPLTPSAENASFIRSYLGFCFYFLDWLSSKK